MNTKNCEDCMYWRSMHDPELKCCHYLLDTGSRRPCEPGDGCTVKVKTRAKRRKKKAENVERCICCGDIIPEGRMVCPNCLVTVKENEDGK
jgi:hypothetical protein